MRAPDMQSRWTAWRVPLEPHDRGALSAWLLHCPGAHPFWSYWTVQLIHLHLIEGQRPPHRQYPGAQYELVSLALDPQYVPDPDDAKTFRYMPPVDVCEQFHGITDAQAIELVERFVQLVVAGQLSPDSDARRAWKSLLWTSIEELTSDHPQGHA